MTVESVETQFVERARLLTEQGHWLASLNNLAELDQWDQSVNQLLGEINTALTHGLTSRALKYQLESLTELYLSILRRVTQLQHQKEDDAVALFDLKRRANNR